MPDVEGLEELVKAQHTVIHEQANRIGKAVDLLEELVDDDADPDKVEHIINVLMYGE